MLVASTAPGPTGSTYSLLDAVLSWKVKGHQVSEAAIRHASDAYIYMTCV